MTTAITEPPPEYNPTPEQLEYFCNLSFVDAVQISAIMRLNGYDMDKFNAEVAAHLESKRGDK